MVNRDFWLARVEQAWKERSLVWLRGVRRVGKTSLCRSLPGIEYFDCELPRVRLQMDDAQAFLSGLKGKRVVLDEIHRLSDPAQLLKIAADHFPSVKIIATGSSILEATARFRDKLTGRKRDLWLTPINASDLADFKGTLRHRLVNGGLPPFFLAHAPPEKDFSEWIDSFWAKDIQALFRLERRYAFGRFVELLFAQSGSQFDATRFAAPCEISRATVTNYLAVLEATMSVLVVRPFSSRRATEIVSAPKVYAFDTGFACHFKGWSDPRPEDLGHLWEHYALNELLSRGHQPGYWRDKQGHEIDFVLAGRGRAPTAVECKWKAAAFEPANLRSFRHLYPQGENLVVCSDVERPFERSVGDLLVRFCGVEHLCGLTRADTQRFKPR